MTDERLRALERAWKSGDVEDQARYLAERERIEGFYPPALSEPQIFLDGRLMRRSSGNELAEWRSPLLDEDTLTPTRPVRIEVMSREEDVALHQITARVESRELRR